MISAGRVMTKTEAAKLLGVSERGVYRYISRGYLRLAHDSGRTGVWESEVLGLKRVRDADAERRGELLPFAVNKTTLAMLHARIRTLEMQMTVIARILGVRHDPLGLTDPELAALATTAAGLAEEGWPPHVEEMWAGVFVRLRLEDLEQLERLTGDDHPWRPFHRLCATMCLVPYNPELRAEFVQGRTNLFGLAGVWAHMKGISPSKAESMVANQAAPHSRVVRRMGK